MATTEKTRPTDRLNCGQRERERGEGAATGIEKKKNIARTSNIIYSLILPR